MEIFSRIETLLPMYEAEFEKLADKLELKIVLHKDLQEKLDKLGNTPIAEAKLFEKIKSDVELALQLLTKKQIVKYKTTEVGDFLFAVKSKITSLEDEDGIFKSTPATENCKLPNFLESDEIISSSQEVDKLRRLIITSTDKEREKASENYKKAIEKSRDVMLKISGLDVDKLTEWEVTLIAKQMFETALDGAKSAMGKQY